MPYFYAPLIYRLALASAYIRGFVDRKNAATSINVINKNSDNSLFIFRNASFRTSKDLLNLNNLTSLNNLIALIERKSIPTER